MRIERNAVDKNGVTTVATLREHCLGCADCRGPCLMLMQMRELPEMVLACRGTQP